MIDKKYRLVILDFNGTLVNTPFIDKQPLALLPGRSEKCMELQAKGIQLAIASNQGGVAFGIMKERDAQREIKTIADLLHIDNWQVAFGHPKPKAGYERYMEAEHMIYRKPSPGMLFMARDDASETIGVSIPFDAVLYVGDRPEDELAAKCAGISFMWADNFFGEEI